MPSPPVQYPARPDFQRVIVTEDSRAFDLRFTPSPRVVATVPLHAAERAWITDPMATPMIDLARVLDALGTFVGVHDAQCRIVYWNAPALAWIRCRHEDVVGRVFFDVVDVAHDGVGFTRLRHAVDEAMRGGSSEVVLRSRSADAVIRPFRVRIAPFALSTGERGVLMVGDDASAELEAQTSLRQTETALRAAEQVGGVGSWHWDLASGSIHWSPALFGLYGLPVPPRAEAIDGWALVRTMAHPDDLTRLERTLSEAIDGDADHYVGQFRIHRADTGRWHTLAVQASITRDEQRVARSVSGVNIDVTARDAALQRAVVSEARFRQLADDLPVLVWEHDASGRLTFVNRATVEFLGQARADILAEGWEPPFHPDDAAAYRTAVQTANVSRQPFQVRTRLRHRDGTWHTIDSLGRPRVDETGRSLGFIGTSLDVTEQEMAEARARDAREALRQTAAALEEAHHRKDAFLALLAHELRNPLAPVRYAAQLLKARATDDVLITTAREMIDRQVAHMSRLVDDLLDVSRVTRGKITLQLAPLDLGQLVAHVLHDARAAIDKANLTLDWTPPADALPVVGDAVRLAQVVGNLLNNAIKFTPAGGTITVRVAIDDDTARLDVADTGIGIDAALLPSLFEPFVQGSSPTAQHAGGLGLGLALVRGLVELHAGRVAVSSEGPGRGTQVVVTLPAAGASRRPLEVIDLPPTSAPPVGPRRVLLVEDHDDAARGLSLLLTVNGYVVTVARDGDEAIALAEAGAFDAVLSDLGLPGSRDGYAIARALRAMPQYRATRIIALSGFGRAEDIARSSEAGFDAHLVKPATLDAIEAALRAPTR